MVGEPPSQSVLTSLEDGEGARRSKLTGWAWYAEKKPGGVGAWVKGIGLSSAGESESPKSEEPSVD